MTSPHTFHSQRMLVRLEIKYGDNDSIYFTRLVMANAKKWKRKCYEAAGGCNAKSSQQKSHNNENSIDNNDNMIHDHNQNDMKNNSWMVRSIQMKTWKRTRRQKRYEWS